MKKLFVVIVLLFFFAAGYLLIAFNYSYSEGSRAGYIQKFSHKGWICKTHEGELAMTTVPGVAPILWDFSVRDAKVASQLSEAMGKRLVLHYKEFRYLPTTCFGETAYFVDRVDITDE
jgi:hypothetical protein